jgi:hypothetical protein
LTHPADAKSSLPETDTEQTRTPAAKCHAADAGLSAVKSESLERLAARAAHSLNIKIHQGTAAAIKKARQRPDNTSQPEADS